MVAIRHIQQFIQDHPRYFGVGEPSVLLATAVRIAESTDLGGDILYSGQVKQIFPQYANEMFHLVETDPRYIEISMEVMRLYD